MAAARPRWIAAGFAVALGCAAPGPSQTAEPEAAGAPAAAETLGLDRTRTDRMTVPVRIGEGGPYRFIVDTGSERTVISRELAQRLRLQPGIPVTIYSMTEISRSPTAILPALRVGRRTMSNIHAPTLGQQWLGAEGLLGVDSLSSQRVELDFRNGLMTVTPSRAREEQSTADTIVVTAQSRFGRLILVDAALDGERVYVVIDTGAQVSIANNALRSRLERRRRMGPTAPIQLTSVTGGTLIADYGSARRLRISGVEILNLPLAFADVEPFEKLRLADDPAILLGMDALQLFERVSLDFATRRVRLEMRRRTG